MAKGKKTGGRTKGTPNKSTELQKQRAEAIVAKATEAGLTPLEIMTREMNLLVEELDASREEIAKLSAIRDRDGRQESRLAELRNRQGGIRKELREWTKDAAPYVHPRLESTTLQAPGGGVPVIHHRISFV